MQRRFFVPSEKAIRAAFSHALDAVTLRDFRDAARTGKRTAALQLAGRLLDGHGGESIRCPQRGLLAVYVNTGDTYSPTLLCNTATGAWRVTTWGEFVETFERRHGRAASERLAAF